MDNTQLVYNHNTIKRQSKRRTKHLKERINADDINSKTLRKGKY